MSQTKRQSREKRLSYFLKVEYDLEVERRAGNALVNDLRVPDLSIASFGRLLKTYLLQQYPVHQAH